jgi:putative nucleotidyltransferase with HDIG domain
VPESSPAPLTRSVRAFTGAVGAMGVAVVAYSLSTLWTLDIPAGWIAFSLLTFACGNALSLPIPLVQQVRVSVSEVFAFSNILLYGPELAAITVTIDGLLMAVRWRHAAAQTLFNFGNLSLSIWVSASLFFRVAGVEPLSVAPAPYGALIVPLGALTAAYFALNTGLTATIVALDSRRRPWIVWRDHFMPLAPTYAAGASVGFLLILAWHQFHFSAIALILPLLLISYLTTRSSFGRLEDAKRHVEKVNGLYLSTIETLATAIDAKDEVTHGHIRRVQAAAVGLARELGVSDEPTLKAIEAAALLHDTGKIAVPEHILNKPGALTPAEFEKMKLHAPIGAAILSSIDFPYPVVPIVRHHHENWDGTGYPDGLKGADIPIGARILSVVDCFDALTSDRPYRPRMSDERALAILRERRGTMYDPAVIDVFVEAHGRIMPGETALHPAAKVVGSARARRREEHTDSRGREAAAPKPAVADEVLGVSSLSRALAGRATTADVGALFWMMLKPMVPCTSMGLFVPDEATDTLVGCYAAGAHAGLIRGLTTTPGDGIVGWVAANRRLAFNAEPALDFGLNVLRLEPPLASSLAVPLLHEGTLLAVLSVYSDARKRFTDDHARLLELVEPQLAASLAAVTGERSERPATRRAGTEGGPAVGSVDLRLLRGGRLSA